jgi:hypothetical protein
MVWCAAIGGQLSTGNTTLLKSWRIWGIQAERNWAKDLIFSMGLTHSTQAVMGRTTRWRMGLVIRSPHKSNPRAFFTFTVKEYGTQNL